jgi:uncharacterized lipoprotein
MSFADELNKIKQDRARSDAEEVKNSHQAEKDKFTIKIQNYIDNIEEIKTKIK